MAVASNQRTIGLVATVEESGSILKINGTRVSSGALKTIKTVAAGSNIIPFTVTARDRVSIRTYQLNLVREACMFFFIFNSYFYIFYVLVLLIIILDK